MERVAVLGMSGAGKSTFAAALGAAIGAPVVHLDALYWQPGWVAAEWDDFRARHAEVIAGARCAIADPRAPTSAGQSRSAAAR